MSKSFSARRKLAAKRGENPEMATFHEDQIEASMPSERLMAVHEALSLFEEKHPEMAQIVKMRFFAGMTVPERSWMTMVGCSFS